MSGENKPQTITSKCSDDDGVTTISDGCWDDTSWLSSTSDFNNETNVQPKLKNQIDKSKAVSEEDKSQTSGYAASKEVISSSSQTKISNRDDRTLTIQVFAIVISVCIFWLSPRGEVTGNISVVLSGYYSLMLTIDLVGRRSESLKLSFLNVDLFSFALNLSVHTFVTFVFEIYSDGWQVVDSNQFRILIWNRIKFTFLLQTEGWILSKVTNSQVQAASVLQFLIVVQVLLK